MPIVRNLGRPIVIERNTFNLGLSLEALGLYASLLAEDAEDIDADALASKLGIHPRKLLQLTDELVAAGLAEG